LFLFEKIYQYAVEKVGTKGIKKRNTWPIVAEMGPRNRSKLSWAGGQAHML
jgi:hypothetical protein